MVDLKGHPFIQKQYNDMCNCLKRSDISGAAICQRSIASQICRFYAIKYFPKYKDFYVNDDGFPTPMEMAKMVDAMGIIENRYSELLHDMVAEGNKAAHPEGKVAPSERNVKNINNDLPEFLSVFIKEFPNETAYKSAGKKSTNSSSTANKTTKTKSKPTPSNKLKPDNGMNSCVIVEKAYEKHFLGEGYIVDQYYFNPDSISNNQDVNVSFSFNGEKFTISETFYTLCVNFLRYLFDNGIERNVFSISVESKSIRTIDNKAISSFFGKNLTQQEMIELDYILILRTLYPRTIRGKKIGLNDLCPCGSGKRFKHCCVFLPRIWDI